MVASSKTKTVHLCEILSLHTTHKMVVPPPRVEDGQHEAKRMKMDDRNTGKRNSQLIGNMWRQSIEQISGNHFPALGLEKQKSTGKYIKIHLENSEKNVHNAHPIELGQVIKQYFDGHTEQQRAKNCIIIKTKDKKQFQNVMNLKQPITVKVGGLPEKIVFENMMARNQTKGIVFEQSWNDLSEEEIKSELIKEGHEVHNVRQLKKKSSDGTETKTVGVVISFDSEELPERVKICGISYRIRQYFPSPLVCGKCLKLGHIKVNCKAENETCRDCGDTKEAMHECTTPISCPNCNPGENLHKPNGKECKAMEHERLVIQHKTVYRTSWVQARKVVEGFKGNGNQTWSNVTKPIEQMTSSSQDQQLKETSVQNAKETLRKLQSESAELEEINRQIRAEIEKLKRLREEQTQLTQQLKDEQERYDQIQTRTFNQNNRGRSRSTSNKQKTIANSVEKPPSDAILISEDELIVETEKLSNTQKRRVTTAIEKAKSNNRTISWYKTKEKLIPVETNIQSTSPGL